MAARLMARTVRGVESILAEEIRQRGLGHVEHIGHREVWFRCADPGRNVLELRCADDVFLLASIVDGIGRCRADLSMLTKAVQALPLEPLLAIRERCGGLPGSCVEVSASFLGKRNYTRYDLEDAVGKPLARALGMRYHSRRGGVAPPAGGLAWRVTLADDRAVVGLRIAERPLHRRAYRRISTPGALHPPLAAAMVRLAAPSDGAVLLDPCCGVGTIPIEAAYVGRTISILGSDVNPTAVAAAATNGVGTGIRWSMADAGRLPVATGAVDLVVTNPPWDRQVPWSGVLARHPGRLWRELRRVLRPTGRAVLLLTDVEARLVGITEAGLVVRDRRPISLFGAHPEIVTVEVI